MWTKELIELLLIKYEENENLYNVRSPLYLDRVKRSNSLFSICQDLKTINKDITVEAIKKKIHTLRAQFIKESRQIANSKRSGVGADDVYSPKLWCFSNLQFLKSHCTTRKSESNISETDGSDNSFVVDVDNSESNSEKESQTSFKKRKKNVLEDKIDNVKKMFLEKSQQKNCFDWLGKEVVYQIGKIKNEKIQQDTVWKIQQILRQSYVEDTEVEPQRSCSFFTPPHESSFLPIQTHRSSTGLSSNHLSTDQQSPQLFDTEDCYTQSSTLSTNDILQQSLIGVLDDEDF